MDVISNFDQKKKNFSLYKRRVILLSIPFLVMFLIFFLQILSLSVFNSSIYATASENNRIINIPIYSTRGLIRDENENLIVENIVHQKLIIVPEKTIDLATSLLELQDLLSISDRDILFFKRSLSKRTYKYEPITLVRNLSPEQVAKYSINKERWPSVRIEANLVRQALDGPLYSHIIGYMGQVDTDNISESGDFKYKLDALIGKAGIEKFYENILRGSVGYKTVEADVHGALVRQLSKVDPLTAPDLFLSIDKDLQSIARESMIGKSGAVIAMDPKSGFIKALVSFPDYDPVTFNQGQQESLKAIMQNKNSPLFNRAVSGKYPPASTIKPFLGLLGLNKSLIDWGTSVEDNGVFQVKEDGRVFKGWKEGGHGEVNLTKAIIESSDVYFYNLALKLKINEISDFLKSIGFNSITGIDLDNEQTGTVPDQNWKLGQTGSSWYVGDTVNIGIGQGYLTATPIQLVVAASALANKGKAYKPKLVKRIGSNQVKKELLYTIETSKENWTKMEDALISVISSWNGTAHNIYELDSNRIAGKTGTAQTSSLQEEEEYSVIRAESSRRDHALFIGYGPIPDPSLAIIVIVEYGESGSAVAAPIAKKLFDSYFTKKL